MKRTLEQGHPSSKSHSKQSPKNTFQSSLCRVTKIVASILHSIEDSIENVQKDRLVSRLNQQAANLEIQVERAHCPKIFCEEAKNNIDLEPSPHSFDPLCGFDKLLQLKRCLTDDKIYHIKAKQSLLGPRRQLRAQGEGAARPKHLVPLKQIQTETDLRLQTVQQFHRDRLLKAKERETAPLPSLNPIKSVVTREKENQFGFDFDGEKISILPASKTGGVQGNVLKAIYKIQKERPIAKASKPELEKLNFAKTSSCHINLPSSNEGRGIQLRSKLDNEFARTYGVKIAFSKLND